MDKLEAGQKFTVSIKVPEDYSLAGVKNGDTGVVVSRCDYNPESEDRGDTDYVTNITLQDGTVVEGFFIFRDDMVL